MKRGLFVGLGLLLAGYACDPEQSLSEVLEGKSCRMGECVGGYYCDLTINRCVKENPVALGSSGAGGAPQADPRDGGPPAGEAGSAAGSGTSGAGQDTVDSGVSDTGDAGPDSCVPEVLFRDRDGDGYGSVAEGSEERCPSEGWVEQGEDCFDAEGSEKDLAAQVHPGQMEFFPEGYPRPGLPDDVSFDYDCDGVEEVNPDRTVASTNCSSDDPMRCNAPGIGTGVIAGGRSGAGANGLCGSIVFQTCNSNGLNGCAPQVQSFPTLDPVECR